MRTDRDVQDGDVHFVVYDIFDRGHEFARLPADGLAGFHDNLHARVPLHEFLEDADELGRPARTGHGSAVPQSRPRVPV